MIGIDQILQPLDEATKEFIKNCKKTQAELRKLRKDTIEIAKIIQREEK